MFYYCTQYCNSVRMTCLIKRQLILSYLYLKIVKALMPLPAWVAAGFSMYGGNVGAKPRAWGQRKIDTVEH